MNSASGPRTQKQKQRNDEMLTEKLRKRTRKNNKIIFLPDASSPFPQIPTPTKRHSLQLQDDDLVVMEKCLDEDGDTAVTPRISLCSNAISTSPSLSSLMDADHESSDYELHQSAGCPPCGTPVEREVLPTIVVLPDIETVRTVFCVIFLVVATAFGGDSPFFEFQLDENGSNQSSDTQAVLLPDLPTISAQPEVMDLSRYLNDTAALNIDPVPLGVSVSRRALSKSFGLPGMGFLWTSRNKQHRFLTPTYDVYPDMPRYPGAPGLLLSCREEVSNNAPWSLFGKIEAKKKPMLEYRGEYKCYVVGQMTREEFTAQESSVKQTWGIKIAKHKRYSVYRDMRARMTLRLRYNNEPTEREIIEESELINGRKYASPLTSDDVIDAFERGDEHIKIVKIVCVSYSHRRAQEFLNAQTNLEAVDAASRACKDTTVGNMRKNISTIRPSTNVKKARLVWSDDSSESESDSYAEY
ncbi:hypothetical protein JR316_0002790 [Psilocybe cubensis]|uniref:DUF6697 domain-containing protein n=2 Tax=Psilocybe cubensis TaxID=181762 RepID=A0A8H7Y8L3_PSICU|nr:hypothetical protein JR316_0002790 [Psilocybe cubensis]KAH9485875.1 hypothetical protein JR316_0002790 [Psilocybe cubensis]